MMSSLAGVFVLSVVLVSPMGTKHSMETVEFSSMELCQEVKEVAIRKFNSEENPILQYIPKFNNSVVEATCVPKNESQGEDILVGGKN